MMRDIEKKITRMDYLRLSGAGILAGFAVLSGGMSCSGGDTGNKSCADCTIRKNYDKDPSSLMGRMWKWHIQYCPGWKAYVSSLSEQERKLIEERYR
jgi:hypothetical protein